MNIITQNNYFTYKNNILTIFGPLGKKKIKLDLFNFITLFLLDYKKNKFDLKNTKENFIKNSIKGVNLGFLIRLELIGANYRCTIQKNRLILKFGSSQIYIIKIPENINIMIKNNILSIFGINLEQLKTFVFYIMSLKKTNKYKKKGFYII